MISSNDNTLTIVASDIEVRNHGTIVSLTATSMWGEAFLDQLPTEGWQWMGRTLNVDHRLAPHIIEGAQDDGLFVTQN